MADNPVLNRVSGFAAQPVTRQLSLLIGMAASVALGVGIVDFAMKPAFEPLFGAMSPTDNATAINTLQSNGITYELEQGTGMLLVPYDQVLRARMVLASEGFPRTGGVGFESLYEEQQMGLSSFMEQARYHRAVEAELARTIAAMDSVSAARVHLAVSKQSAFMRRGNEPSASVMLNLTPGTTLGGRQLAGIIHLVASSISNLDASRVSVVDQAGKLLSDQGQDNDFGYTAEQFRIAQQLEKAMSDRILSILEPLFGPGAVRAQVTADMDFTRIERTSETFDPETVLRSEQSTEDIANKLAGVAGGVPGTLTNQPPEAATINNNPQNQPPQVVQQDDRPARESRKVTRNFEVNKNIAHIREVPGTLNRLSVAVVVDYVLDAEGNKVALDQARIDQINQLVREAVGFNQARGDTLSVINSPFVAPAPIEEIPEPGLLEQGWFWQAVRVGGAGLALLLIFLMVVRPLIAYSTSYMPPGYDEDEEDEDQPRLSGPGDEFGDDTVSIGGQAALPGAAGGGANYQQNVAMARNVANEQPARAAYVVRNWIAADG